MNGTHHIVADPWLSEKLERDAYRLLVNEALIDETASDERARLETLMNRRVFIYAKINPMFVDGMRFLRRLNFDLVDTNVLFDKPLRPGGSTGSRCRLRYARPEDRDATVDLARRSFRYSRFHLDPAIGKETADAIKAAWAANYFARARGEQMVIATVNDAVVGFVQLLHDRDRTLTIDLIAVDERHRRQGIARNMIGFAEAGAEGCQRVRAGTQIANVPSIRLYEGLGFRMAESSYVYHYHHE